jgi:hypothetical protein
MQTEGLVGGPTRPGWGCTTAAPRAGSGSPSCWSRCSSAASTGQNDISNDATATIWYAAALSASDTCFSIKDDVSSGTGPNDVSAAGTKW